MSTNKFKPLHSQIPSAVFVVEDNEQDYEIFMRVVKKNNIKCIIHHFETGEEILKILDNRDLEKYPKLSVILLDLNLPGTDGKIILQKIKSDPLFKFIPVVIFSSSSNVQDIEDCYNKGANAYIIKPMDVSLLQEYIQVMLSHWLKINITLSSVL